MSNRPLIGITMDWQKEGSFSVKPHYALRDNYFAAVHAAGGLPVAIPNIPDALPEYLSHLNGVVVPGGDFAFDPAWYVASDEPFPYPPNPRFKFDVAVIESALKRDMPLLGICAGMQMMGSILGGKMTRNIHTYLKTDIDHLRGAPRDDYAHDVIVTEGTALSQITGKKQMPVNSAHTEALVELPKNVVLSAEATDGAIEAIEIPGKRFAIGVQWHPEFFAKEGTPDFALFKAFITACKEGKAA
ncbi:MAG: gamma-glutamyl-gamma-aminobutyrate hydrolase family protein [Proteobacteria bacterium]|nr:gamma-glutamyl-gamma-aminobutyrate hydrolase family protein [Pseudomonadota bacterium]